jgi:hypothetical protein
MVELTVVGTPYARHRLGGAIGPGRRLRTIEQPSHEQRPSGSGSPLRLDNQMGAAHAPQLTVAEPESANLRADEAGHSAVVVRGDQRRHLRIRPRMVEQGRAQELDVASPIGEKRVEKLNDAREVIGSE